MKSSDIRSKFLKFFEERGHAIVASSSLVPGDDHGPVARCSVNFARTS